MAEPSSIIAAEGAQSVKEALKEVQVNEILKEAPLSKSIETIENNSLESLKVRNETSIEQIELERAELLEENRENGARREELAYKELQQEFPEDENYIIEREQYLRDKEGRIVRDSETGESRRIDFVVIKGDNVVKMVEVTSEKAFKDFQMAKEYRIRASGGNYIRDIYTGKLIEIPPNIRTEIRRYP